jgi:hypothetical protein
MDVYQYDTERYGTGLYRYGTMSAVPIFVCFIYEHRMFYFGLQRVLI